MLVCGLAALLGFNLGITEVAASRAALLLGLEPVAGAVTGIAVLESFEIVLGRALSSEPDEPDEPACLAPPGIHVRRSGDGEFDDWLEVVLDGAAHADTDVIAVLRAGGRVAASAADSDGPLSASRWPTQTLPSMATTSMPLRSTWPGPTPPRPGVADRARFHVADAATVTGGYDLVTAFECIHDLPDPVSVLAACAA